MKILDTTFLIDLLNGDHGTVAIAKSKETLLTTQINMYEVIRGIFLINESKALVKARALFGQIRVLPLDDNSIIKSADIFADLSKRGEIIADNDCMTAGIALANGINKVVTRNTKHFRRIKGIKPEMY